MRKSLMGWVLAVVASTLSLPVAAQVDGDDSGEGQERAVRPEIGESLQAAQSLIKQGDYPAAEEKIEEAENAVDSVDPYEQYVIDRVRGSLATAQEDYARAVEIHERVLDSGELPQNERVAILEATGRMAYMTSMYLEAVDYLYEYRELGGQDNESITLLAQALYITGRHAEVVSVLADLIETLESSGVSPEEHQLQLLGSAQVKINDSDGYLQTLRKRVSHHPGVDVWRELIQRTVKAMDIPRRFAIHVYRLRQWTRTLGSAADYMQATQLALQEGFPGEARQFINEGFESGVLGTGGAENADRHQRLKRLVEREVSEDQQTMGEGEKEAALQEHGDALVNTGYNFVTYGQYEKGRELMQKGMAKSSFQNPGEVRLLQGYALLLAGHQEAATKAFLDVESTPEARELARLWILAIKGGE